MKYLSEVVNHITQAIERMFRLDAIGAFMLILILCCGCSSLIKSCGIAAGYIIHGPPGETIRITETESKDEP